VFAILTVSRNTCCQLSVSIEFPVDRKLFVCIWYTWAPEAKELNPQAMCYRSTTLFRLDNIESLNERRKRDVHSIKSANISFSWGFLYVDRKILDNPKIVRKWSKQQMSQMFTNLNHMIHLHSISSFRTFLHFIKKTFTDQTIRQF